MSVEVGATDAISRDAKAAAEQTLKDYWNLADQPTIPVDSIFIARRMGIKVWIVKREDDVAGILVKQSAKPEIYLSEVDDREYQRFACAHVLGHYVRHQAQDPGGSWANVDVHDQLSGRGSDPDERYASTFAAFLLMPDSELTRRWDHLSLNKRAFEFGVPIEAMTYRLANLTDVSPSE